MELASAYTLNVLEIELMGKKNICMNAFLAFNCFHSKLVRLKSRNFWYSMSWYEFELFIEQMVGHHE